MDAPLAPLRWEAAAAQAFSDFRTLTDAATPDGRPRHAERPVLVWLARLLAARDGGPQRRQEALGELLGLVDVLDRSSLGVAGRYHLLFGPGPVSPERFGQALGGAALPEGAAAQETALQWQDGTIPFRRMPCLAALLEFLLTIEGMAHQAKVMAALDRPAAKGALDGLSSLLEQYLSRHLPDGPVQRLFDEMMAVAASAGGLDDGVTDALPLALYAADQAGQTVGSFRVAFGAVVNLGRALSETKAKTTAADPFGLGAFGEWYSPLHQMAEEGQPQNELMMSGARTQFDGLSLVGPWAYRLPRSFLMAEVFGRVEAGIQAELAAHPGQVVSARRLECLDAPSYETVRAVFGRLFLRVERLEQAALLVYEHHRKAAHYPPNVVPLRRVDPEALFEQAVSGLMEGADLDLEQRGRMRPPLLLFGRSIANGQAPPPWEALATPGSLEGAHRRAVALTTLRRLLAGFLDALERQDCGKPGLSACFEADRAAFVDLFGARYGGRP